MKGRRVVLAVVVLLALLIATPALARGPGGGGGGHDVATALGTISSIDYDELWFEMDVIKSNGLVHVDELLVLTTDDTHIKLCLGDGEFEIISFDQLGVGDTVRVDGAMVGEGSLDARRVTLYPD